MSIQLRRPIVAGYGPASRGAIARDDATSSEEARGGASRRSRARGSRRGSTRAIDVDDAKRVLALRA